MAALAKLPIYMTVLDFMEWESNDGLRYELVDGEPRAMAPASNLHGFLQNELGRLIGNHLRQRGDSCDVLINPGVRPRVLPAHNIRIPDLGVTCSPLRPGQTEMPDPILLVEVLSPSNASKTWSNVWAYTSIPSVQEILVLHGSRVAARPKHLRLGTRSH